MNLTSQALGRGEWRWGEGHLPHHPLHPRHLTDTPDCGSWPSPLATSIAASALGPTAASPTFQASGTAKSTSTVLRLITCSTLFAVRQVPFSKNVKLGGGRGGAGRGRAGPGGEHRGAELQPPRWCFPLGNLAYNPLSFPSPFTIFVLSKDCKGFNLSRRKSAHVCVRARLLA